VYTPTAVLFSSVLQNNGFNGIHSALGERRCGLWQSRSHLYSVGFLWSPYGIGQTIIFSSCGFFYFFFFFLFFLANLSRRRLDVCHTSTHGVALVRIEDAGLKRAARGSLKNTGRKKVAQKSPSGHRRTPFSGYIFATKARIDNRKKILSSNMSCTRLRNTVNFGPLTAEIGSAVWGHPCKFQLVSRLGSAKARHLVVGVSQTLRR